MRGSEASPRRLEWGKEERGRECSTSAEGRVRKSFFYSRCQRSLAATAWLVTVVLTGNESVIAGKAQLLILG